MRSFIRLFCVGTTANPLIQSYTQWRASFRRIPLLGFIELIPKAGDAAMFVNDFNSEVY